MRWEKILDEVVLQVFSSFQSAPSLLSRMPHKHSHKSEAPGGSSLADAEGPSNDRAHLQQRDLPPTGDSGWLLPVLACSAAHRPQPARADSDSAPAPLSPDGLSPIALPRLAETDPD